MNVKEVLENEFYINENSDKIITKNIEACIVLILFGSKKIGVAHIRPSLYINMNHDTQNTLKDFIKLFDKKTECHIIGGINDVNYPDRNAENIIMEYLKPKFNSINKHEHTYLHKITNNPAKIWNVVVDTATKSLQVEEQDNKRENWNNNKNSILYNIIPQYNRWQDKPAVNRDYPSRNF